MVKSLAQIGFEVFGDLLMPLSYLISFALWLAGFCPDIHGIGDFFLSAVLAAFASLISCVFVALGLCVLCIPIKALMKVINRLRKRN